MLHMKLFLFNFNDFTITKMVQVPWDGVLRECGLKLFGLVFLRVEILSWRRHYPEVLKLMVKKVLLNLIVFKYQRLRRRQGCRFSWKIFPHSPELWYIWAPGREFFVECIISLENSRPEIFINFYFEIHAGREQNKPRRESFNPEQGIITIYIYFYIACSPPLSIIFLNLFIK